ncbi:hypothetical protein PtA15_17A189 [Puccinia triticina]|uniref:Uncharacterized protein n=1 Tax=Puccinia triticina TaxID=208348 RepID=A0ABY7D7T0_9BASI|nr:uncharacterized protein PtA15_17A189 [Puccinia triticina]WAQ92707.1 hypothetical protein PtA15_17A189 [Puccinia triticina]
MVSYQLFLTVVSLLVSRTLSQGASPCQVSTIKIKDCTDALNSIVYDKPGNSGKIVVTPEQKQIITNVGECKLTISVSQAQVVITRKEINDNFVKAVNQCKGKSMFTSFKTKAGTVVQGVTETMFKDEPFSAVVKPGSPFGDPKCAGENIPNPTTECPKTLSTIPTGNKGQLLSIFTKSPAAAVGAQNLNAGCSLSISTQDGTFVRLDAAQVKKAFDALFKGGTIMFKGSKEAPNTKLFMQVF